MAVLFPGGPVLPVGICVALWLEEYGGAERCWFSNNVMVGLISSLGIPALINVLVLVYISGKNVPTGTTLQNGTDDNHATRQRAMDGLRSNVLILVLLCLCWGFGIAAFQQQDDFLQQAFAVSALLLGVCFFMMFLVLSHDVRQAILHGRKKNRRKNQNRMKLRQRKSDDSLMTNSTNPDTGESRQQVHVQPPSRNDRSLGSTSTTLSQHNTHSIGTNCTDLAGEPIHEEGYGPYRRGNGAPHDLAMDHRNVGYDQRMLPWSNLGMIRGGPESLSDRSPQMVRRGDRSPDMVRRSRREASPRRRNGNVILNHRIVKEAEEGRSTEEESQHKKREKKRHVSSISGSSHGVDMSCMPFPYQMDWRDIRGSRVHPMPLDQIPYSMDYSQGPAQPQYIHPRMAGFLVQPHRALPGPAPSTSLGRGPIPEVEETRQDLGAFQRSLGYYGNEGSNRDSFYDGQHQARDSFRMPFRGQSSRTGYQGRGPEPHDGHHRNWASNANESRPGPSGYTPRGDSIDSQASTRSSEGMPTGMRAKKGILGKRSKVTGQARGGAEAMEERSTNRRAITEQRRYNKQQW
ncbi:uncharacterized protein LOC119735699 [Patiria miniata]|uniref:G-protein coupled receptors family 2 profile 2 domain-containing protein n=1 Tax=Patiria miniata TaxID=46514 RepID=A0A914APE1_PATMI|nr:uncharacterized protein LOC119735699 [Patiria miniata]